MGRSESDRRVDVSLLPDAIGRHSQPGQSHADDMQVGVLLLNPCERLDQMSLPLTAHKLAAQRTNRSSLASPTWLVRLQDHWSCLGVAPPHDGSRTSHPSHGHDRRVAWPDRGSAQHRREPPLPERGAQLRHSSVYRAKRTPWLGTHTHRSAAMSWRQPGAPAQQRESRDRIGDHHVRAQLTHPGGRFGKGLVIGDDIVQAGWLARSRPWPHRPPSGRASDLHPGWPRSPQRRDHVRR